MWKPGATGFIEFACRHASVPALVADGRFAPVVGFDWPALLNRYLGHSPRTNTLPHRDISGRSFVESDPFGATGALEFARRETLVPAFVADVRFSPVVEFNRSALVKQ